eukprot:s2321_g7.t1
MASIVDSEAQFDLRLSQVKVPVLLQRALKTAGVNTISSLAYSFGQPGQPIQSDEFTAWVKSLEPTASVGGVAALKRLLFESQTQLLADLKDKILNPEPASARRVPAAERDARLANLRARLIGVDRESDHEAAVQSSYQAIEALKRRGLALEFAGVMSYVNHERYVQLLFAHLNRDPPAGYNRCSVSQLLAADKAAWSSLIEKNVKPRPDAAGVMALYSKLEDALKSYTR